MQVTSRNVAHAVRMHGSVYFHRQFSDWLNWINKASRLKVIINLTYLSQDGVETIVQMGVASFSV